VPGGDRRQNRITGENTGLPSYSVPDDNRLMVGRNQIGIELNQVSQADTGTAETNRESGLAPFRQG